MADTASAPLLDLLGRFPDLFAQKVLVHLDPIDLTFFAQAGSACRTAVAASDLPRAGEPRVDESGKTTWVVQHMLEEFVSSVDRLAWAKASGCRWDVMTAMLVAHAGRLDVLKWARDHYCPWDSNTCFFAARYGHLELLKWAREHGCPWNKRKCAGGNVRRHLETRAWVRQQPE